jgi:hypothetical protein
MKKIILSTFLASALFVSCDKTDDKTEDEGNVAADKVYLPKKYITPDYTVDFTYDASKKLTKYSDSDGYIYSFTYNGNELISFESENEISKDTYTFTKQGNVITLQITGEVGEDTFTDTQTLTVDNNGNLLNDGYYSYTYDAKGNVTKMSSADEQLIYTYDDKNGMFKNLNLPKWVIVYFLSEQGHIVNNATSFSYTDEEFPEDNYSAQIQYEYNADNYPTKGTMTSSEGGSQIVTIQYVQ